MQKLACLLVLVPSIAFAQEAAPSAETFLGLLLKLAYVGCVGVLAWGAWKLSQVFDSKATANRAMAIVSKLWVKAQAVASHVEGEMRPDIQKALADGRLTPEEGRQLKAKAMELLKEQAAAELGQLPKVLGLTTDSMISGYLSGLLEKAVAAIKSPSVSPLPGITVPPPPTVAPVVSMVPKLP